MQDIRRKDSADLYEGFVLVNKGKVVDIFCPEIGKVIQINSTKRHQLIVGDSVGLSREDVPNIIMRHNRRNALIRLDDPMRHPIAANIDMAYVVLAPVPAPWDESIAQYLCYLYVLNIPCAFIINKIDLGQLSPSILSRLNYAQDILNCPVFKVSASSGEGLVALRQHLEQKTSIMIGPSGVGKSSLVQALLAEKNIVIGDLSAAQKGRHTTSVTQKYLIDQNNGWLIDSPGVRQCGLGSILKEEILLGFPDFQKYPCQFRNCNHIQSKGCGVQHALDEKILPAHRYEDYLFLCQKFSVAHRYERHF